MSAAFAFACVRVRVKTGQRIFFRGYENGQLQEQQRDQVVTITRRRVLSTLYSIFIGWDRIENRIVHTTAVNAAGTRVESLSFENSNFHFAPRSDIFLEYETFPSPRLSPKIFPRRSEAVRHTQYPVAFQPRSNISRMAYLLPRRALVLSPRVSSFSYASYATYVTYG